MRRSAVVNFLLVGAVVVIFALSSVFAQPPSSADEEAFAGTDAVVTQMLEDQGAEPWLRPIFEPGSGEIESGLFALQAALGAGVLGFALGNLRGRNAERQRASRVAAEQAEATADGGD